ncbi:hypothetical protein K438DRAFT_1864431 [Mycena galopus ATCC 62051]|nr:hypothetical protein K438DRAFT_1864431 [Mycena galopus ATCC 62051]
MHPLLIEHLVHNETRRIHWTMHRPRNGWYIRIRSLAFQPGAFILPLPNSPTCPARSCLSRARMRLYYMRRPRYSCPLALEHVLIHARRRYEPADSPPTPTASAPSLVVHPPTRACMRGASKRRRRNKRVVINEHRRRRARCCASRAPTPSSCPPPPPRRSSPASPQAQCHLYECAKRQRSAPILRGAEGAAPADEAASCSSGASRLTPPSTTFAMSSPSSASRACASS